MNETGLPLTLAARHGAFLQALAQEDRDGAMRQVEADRLNHEASRAGYQGRSCDVVGLT